MKKRACILACIPLLMTTPLAAQANDSVYTDLDTDHCKKLSADDEPGGIVLMCKGYTNHPVYYKEGDLRQAILYGRVNAAYIDGTYETFGPFNYTGRKIEWRLDNAGKPFAAIQRWYISNSGPMEPGPAPTDTGQVLVISKVAGKDGTGCVVGYVDALSNDEPNLLARQIADRQAEIFTCDEDKAAFHGTRGPLATDPVHSFPQP